MVSTEIVGGDTIPTVVHESGTVSLDIVTDSRGFDALEDEWNTLLDRCDASVYQTFEWQRTWWKHFGEGNSDAMLHLIVLRRDGEICGIAPFFVERVRTLGVLGHRRLVFLAQGPSDYLNVLFPRGEEEECAERVASYLAEAKHLFDVMHLEDLTDRSVSHTHLYNALKRRQFRGEHFINEYCPRTTLLGTWEETLASFKIDNRREIRRRARNIEKNFAVEYEVVTDESEAARKIDEFIALHQSKWQNDGHSGVFAESQTGKFHREVATLFARRGWLFLAFLRANGTLAASLYCFLFGDDLAVYLTGNANRSDVFKFSPGRVLTAFCMEEAVKRGKKVCDFMRGTEQYKYELDAKDVPNWAILMYNPHSVRPELRYKFDLLVRSLQRRSAREWLLFKVVAREHGIFSKEIVQHVKTRFRQNVADGMLKAKDPARATHLPTADKRQANGQQKKSDSVPDSSGPHSHKGIV